MHCILLALDYSFLNYFFAGVLLVYISFRLTTPLKTKVQFFNKPVDNYAESLYQNARNQNITLASFSTAVLALLFSVNLPNSDPGMRNENLSFGIIYISLATFFFIIASFTYILLRSRRFPYVGQTFKYQD